ncbi:Bacteriophage integrase [Georgfuchsia toluolica]|uniref:Bacteriophage integrase n=1 Tax=Georgfuchsia toluolica TaxID=424218 RepID=A0A916J4C4_9PROT|nr:site-specific integrase [Georgfuchsia toluolica]CAG4883758.1 Bacteriophage integrase [Georgfuchsia toluolica]
MLFDEVITTYLDARRHEIRSHARSLYGYKRLYPHFAGRKITDIRRADVRDYIESRRVDGVKPATINRELDLLSAAINHARFEFELDIPNPVHKMSLKEPEGRVRWISRDESTRLIEASRLHARTPHLACFIQLALHTGCRKSELLTLEWKTVELNHGFFVLDPKNTKSAKRRTIPINDLAKHVLLEIREWNSENCPGTPWVFSTRQNRRITTFQNGFEAACKRAGIDDFRIHDLRHTCASWLVMQGVPLLAVKELLGHYSIEMTERYAHLAPDHVKNAVQLLLTFE